jgi:FKBP-type peptidyl-prolyl cis-trans isomerase
MVQNINRNRALSLFAGISLIILASCTSGFKKGDGGYEYQIVSKNNDAAKLSYGRFIQFHLKQEYKNDGVDTLLGDTREYMARFKAVDSLAFPPAYLKILQKAAKGDSIVMKISIDSAYNQPDLRIQPFMKQGGLIYTTIKIVDVYKNEYEADSAERREFAANQFKIYTKNLQNVERAVEKNRKQIESDSKSIQAYLDKNHISYIKGKWGTFIVVHDPGSGEKINYNNVVAVNYTGKTFDEGKIFNSNVDPKYEDNNGPYEVTMSRVGDVIPGWADALIQLNNGAKATLYIPSSLAYGKKGALPLIKPNENIIFDIEVVKMITEIQAMEIVSENKRRAKEGMQKTIDSQKK